MKTPDTVTALAVDASASTEANASAAPEKNPNEVDLDTPIKRGDQTISSVTLRKPMAGELRGVSLIELMQMSVGALRTVLPRITSPALLDVEIGRMDPADLVQMGVVISGFLVQRAAKTAASLAE